LLGVLLLILHEQHDAGLHVLPDVKEILEAALAGVVQQLDLSDHGRQRRLRADRKVGGILDRGAAVLAGLGFGFGFRRFAQDLLGRPYRYSFAGLSQLGVPMHCRRDRGPRRHERAQAGLPAIAQPPVFPDARFVVVPPTERHDCIVEIDSLPLFAALQGPVDRRDRLGASQCGQSRRNDIGQFAVTLERLQQRGVGRFAADPAEGSVGPDPLLRRALPEGFH
jgi:hypothetical protein